MRGVNPKNAVTVISKQFSLNVMFHLTQPSGMVKKYPMEIKIKSIIVVLNLTKIQTHGTDEFFVSG